MQEQILNSFDYFFPRSHALRGNAYLNKQTQTNILKWNLGVRVEVLFIHLEYAFPRKAWERGKIFSYSGCCSSFVLNLQTNIIF